VADYSWLQASPYKAKGLDGTDPGTDIAERQRRTAGVVVAPKRGARCKPPRW